jgi:hypothetical protein
MADRGNKHKKDDAGLFVPAGLFLGFGLGFAFNNIPPGLFARLVLGFFLFAIARVFFGK